MINIGEADEHGCHTIDRLDARWLERAVTLLIRDHARQPADMSKSER
jgi:hypothetical protein